MSTYHVTIEDGKIKTWDWNNPIEIVHEYLSSTSSDGWKSVTHIDYPPVYLDKLEVSGNWNWPWVVEIKHNKIFCTAKAIYSDGLHKIKKVFPLQDGTIGLSGGPIDYRYAYFRTREFNEWLREMGLTAVMRLESPKFSFTGHNAYCGAGSASYYCATDGRCIREAPFWSASWLDDYDGFSCDDSETRYEFDNCSWVILSTVENYRDNHNSASILYVPKGVNPLDLTDKIKPYAASVKSQTDGSPSGIYPEGGYADGYDNEMYPEEDYED